MAFKQMENINSFLSFIESYAGIPKHESFMTVDLFEGQDPNSVLVTLAALSRKVTVLVNSHLVVPLGIIHML